MKTSGERSIQIFFSASKSSAFKILSKSKKKKLITKSTHYAEWPISESYAL